MPWHELRFVVPAARADTVAAVLEQLGAQAVTYRSADEQALFDTLSGEAKLWEQTELSALFTSEETLRSALSPLAQAFSPAALPPHQIQALEDQDWATAWMTHFVPLRISDRLWICPSWHTPPDPKAVNIILDPGMAFGTGAHPTTALCLQWLGQSTRLPGARVIDYGCGSGILALAAAKLGAREVWAVDIDAQALRVTRDNADNNDVEHQIRTFLPEQIPAEPAELLIANILARPLVELASTFWGRLSTGGQIALSGILTCQENDCLAAYQPWFKIEALEQSGEWSLISGCRREAETSHG
jgi:ribosomal protein L11 methyltransferase